jgi:hypothetical protein
MFSLVANFQILGQEDPVKVPGTISLGDDTSTVEDKLLALTRVP